MLGVHCVDNSLFFVLNGDLFCHTWVIRSLKNSYLSESGVLDFFNMSYIHLKDKNQVLYLFFLLDFYQSL